MSNANRLFLIYFIAVFAETEKGREEPVLARICSKEDLIKQPDKIIDIDACQQSALARNDIRIRVTFGLTG